MNLAWIKKHLLKDDRNYKCIKFSLPEKSGIVDFLNYLLVYVSDFNFEINSVSYIESLVKSIEKTLDSTDGKIDISIAAENCILQRFSLNIKWSNSFHVDWHVSIWFFAHHVNRNYVSAEKFIEFVQTGWQTLRASKVQVTSNSARNDILSSDNSGTILLGEITDPNNPQYFLHEPKPRQTKEQLLETVSKVQILGVYRYAYEFDDIKEAMKVYKKRLQKDELKGQQNIAKRIFERLFVIEAYIPEEIAFDFSQVTQRSPKNGRFTWQVPYDEMKLPNEKNTWVFFFHDFIPGVPFQYLGVSIPTPDVTEMPEHLKNLKYDYCT